MSVLRRVDERVWAIGGDPPKVNFGPPTHPGTGVRVVPEVEYDRLAKQLRGAVSRVEALERALKVQDDPTLSDEFKARVRADALPTAAGGQSAASPSSQPANGDDR